ncbi:MAG: hypothetical protein ACLUEQ_12810 [Cloacibacillus evryensis]
MKLRPDVVFYLAGNKEMGKMIKNAGLPAVAISPTKWNYDVLRTYDEWIKTLSQIFPESAKSKEVSRYSKVYADIQKVGKIKPADRKRRSSSSVRRQAHGISGRSFFGQYWCDAVERGTPPKRCRRTPNAVIRWSRSINGTPMSYLSPTLRPRCRRTSMAIRSAAMTGVR